MRYIAAADTDIGTFKSINQDSVCVKTAETDTASVALIMVCDGMGGLSKGELASAEVVRSFSDWFDNELPYEIDAWNWETAARRTIKRLRILNEKLVRYGAEHNIRAGTTATGIIAVNSGYMTFHAGDTRIYKISSDLRQLTDDRHVLEPKEIFHALSPQNASTKQEMERSLRDLIDIVKTRNERDNITAAMFRAEF